MVTSDTRIAHWLLDSIVTTTTNYVNAASSTMVAIIGGAATALLTIYVLLWAVGIASGRINEPFTDGVKRVIRIVVIVAFALTAGFYQDQVAQFFLQAPSAVAAKLVAPGSSSGSSPASIADVLDNAENQGIQIGDVLAPAHRRFAGDRRLPATPLIVVDELATRSEVVEAGAGQAYNACTPTAVLLSQRLIGAKVFTK